MRIVSSAEPETIVLPLGVTQTLCTAPLCPTKRKGRMLALKFHTMTELSAEPLMHCLRLGLKQEVSTLSLCPLNERFKLGSIPMRPAPPALEP